jgi:uncharacterized lipoprotein YbaY
MKRWIWTSLAAALALGAGAEHSGKPEVPKEWRAGWETITAEDASKIVHHLAGPEYLGRSALTPDFEKAAHWCADWMRANGIKPGAPNGTYFQPFTMEYRSPDYATLKVKVGGEDITFAKEGDFRFTANADVHDTVPLAFVRLPNNVPLASLDWSKFRKRLVLIHPDTSAEDIRNILAAQAKTPSGVRGIVTVRDIDFAAGGPTRVHAELAPMTAIPANFNISLDAARALARAADADAFAAQNMGKASVEYGEMVMHVKVKREKWYSTMNVVGKITGSDPVLNKEAVVIGAHLDHMGIMRGATYWGADDNASGSGAAMMIGRALMANPVKPKRSVMICLWSSEERGLLGSQMYAGQPSVPMEDTVAYFNMDMVGRDAEFEPFNDKPEYNHNAVYCASAEFSSPELYRFLHDMNKYVGLNLRDDKNDRTRRSDTGSFYDKGVPVLKAFTGEHKDYHKPTDTPDKLNYPKMANVARWLYVSAAELASSDWRPAFEANAKMIVGKAEVLPKTAFSSDTVFYATLIESNPDGTGQSVLDRTSQTEPGQTPFCFALKYRPTSVDPHKMYVIRTSVFEHGKLTYRTHTGLRVLTYNQPADNVVVMMEPRGRDAVEGTATKQQR